MAHPLLMLPGVDRGVIATARELFQGRHFPSVVALVSDALEHDPDCVQLLLLRARAHIALRRQLEAQADLRDIIRLEPTCGAAYRLLGELAARRDENESAAIFFGEALRLDPDDTEAQVWLAIVECTSRPAAVTTKTAAPAASAGRFPRAERADNATHMEWDDDRPRFASGTISPDEETQPRLAPAGPRFALGSSPELQPYIESEGEQPAYFQQPQLPAHLQQTQLPACLQPQPAAEFREPQSWPALPYLEARPSSGYHAQPRPQDRDAPTPHYHAMQIPQHREPPQTPQYRAQQLPQYREPEHATLQGAQPLRRPSTEQRGVTPELPGFGEYLVATGILTRERLRAAQAYQRSMRVLLSTAIVTLGLATPQRIEWAAVAHQSQLARQR